MWGDRGERYRLRSTGEDTYAIEQAECADWRKVGSVFRLNEGTWMALSEFASGLTREADCPYTAAIKLLCNI